jgi:20S proteasome alpha/beta subunit
MTIALGIIASDGIVIAADREQGDGYLKGDIGKILHTFRGRDPIGWTAITGAGSGPEIDEVSKLLTNAFCVEGPRTSDDATAALVAEHRAYYEKVVVPFASASQLDCPDYSLIIGCLQGGMGKSLFVTSKLAFNKVNDYEAVGAGAAVANSWLSRLYDYIPTTAAAKLAAYVIYQVKNSVSGCGLGTDIFMLTGKTLVGRVNPKLIRKWEEVFHLYPVLERNVFNYCLGVQANVNLLRTHPDKEAINTNLDEIRGALSVLEDQGDQGEGNG